MYGAEGHRSSAVRSDANDMHLLLSSRRLQMSKPVSNRYPLYPWVPKKLFDLFALSLCFWQWLEISDWRHVLRTVGRTPSLVWPLRRTIIRGARCSFSMWGLYTWNTNISLLILSDTHWSIEPSGHGKMSLGKKLKSQSTSSVISTLRRHQAYSNYTVVVTITCI